MFEVVLLVEVVFEVVVQVGIWVFTLGFLEIRLYFLGWAV